MGLGLGLGLGLVHGRAAGQRRVVQFRCEGLSANSYANNYVSPRVQLGGATYLQQAPRPCALRAAGSRME